MPGSTPFAVLSRRRWLKLALAGGAAVGLSGGGLLALRGRAPRVAGLRCLSDQEYRTFAALADALLPRGGPFALGAADVDLARRFDGYLADEPDWARSDARAALQLLEWGPLLFARRLATFSHLGQAERLAHFEAWARSDSALRRQVAVGFKKFCDLVFYDAPAAWPALGYDGPLVKP